jgi:hypothetical protein
LRVGGGVGVLGRWFRVRVNVRARGLAGSGARRAAAA